jgi:hypothetical protein
VGTDDASLKVSQVQPRQGNGGRQYSDGRINHRRRSRAKQAHAGRNVYGVTPAEARGGMRVERVSEWKAHVVVSKGLVGCVPVAYGCASCEDL